MRVRAMSTASPSATAPPESPVPAPRGDERHAGQVQQADDLPYLGGGPRHDDQTRIRLAGGQAVHRVGLELGPSVADPAGSDEPPEGLGQGGDHHAEGRLGRACPRPLVCAWRWTWSARSTALDRVGRTRSSASTRRAVERSTRSRCLTVASMSMPAAT